MATDVGWSTEITLDVDAVRGVCHQCRIILIEANSTSFADLGAAVDEAVALGATIVSNSYGGAESGSPASIAGHYNHQNVVITASTGDDGWYGWDHINETPAGFSDGAAAVPSTLNTVVAVGGTSLQLNDNATRASEAVWNDNGPRDFDGFSLGLTGASGGGCSTHVDAQPWQRSVSGYSALGCGTDSVNKVGFRSAADVAAVADPFTGFDTYETTASWCPSGNTDDNGNACPGADPAWSTFGGTSLAAPVVAALWALAGGAGGLKYPSLALYGHFKGAPSSLFDVNFGGNGACDYASTSSCSTAFSGNPNDFGGGLIDCAFPSTGPGTLANRHQCYAAIGFDGPSGVGSPKGNAFSPLNPTAKFTHTPTTYTHGVTQTFTSTSTDPYPGGTLSFVWSWGDGTSSSTTSTTRTHTYATAGTKTLKLTVKDSLTQRTGSISVTITVH